MKLSTYISEKAWLTFLDKGYLACDDIDHSDTAFLDSYAWMVEQMKQRIGPPVEDAIHPLWAWYRDYGGRRTAHTSGWRMERGNKLYRLTFEANDADVLLSNFGDWHTVLNSCYLGISIEDYDQFEAEFEDRALSRERAAKKEDVMKASWERIFDLNLVKVFNGKTQKAECIQACLWKIELSQVTKVQPYVSTGYKWKTIKPRFRCLHDKIQPPLDQYS
jgi:hypothetical protein